MPGSIAHRDPDSRPIEPPGTALGRTPRHPDEDHLALFEQQTTLVIVECDTLGQVVRWNPAAQQVFGYTEQQVLGRPLHALVVPDEHQAVFQALWSEALTGRCAEQAVRNVRADGRPLHVYWTLTPLHDARR
ncbi:PAS domain-containing protein, partial [Aquabacterium sp.]|uniref:PAS domain-containing protein n=1 Tax=Aquabacterium sp. TaxID=1872578 RepID=UPI0035AF7DBA